MALNDYKELKIFHLNRIRYEELWQDCVSYIRQTYNAINQDFNIEPKEGETSIFTVTPISKTAKVPTFEVGEYINTKEYVNNESN